MNRNPISIKAVWLVLFLAIGGAFIAAMSMPMVLASPPVAKDGKAIFLGEKCQECHAMKALGIKKQAAPDAEEVDAPDLSAVGAKRSAEWVEKWLMKKEMIDGKKHEKKMKSGPEDVKTLAVWLAEQKAAKK